MKRKIVVSFILLLFLLSTVVFAADDLDLALNSDLYLATDAYSLLSKVSGNAFLTIKDFEIASDAEIDGDLFVVANSVTLKSNVKYSDATAKDGQPAIDSIISHAAVKGNAYIVCKELTLEPGAEISGDLYIVALNINMQKSSFVGKNIFAVTENFTLNGRVYGSVYATAQEFDMNYFGSIDKDLNLSSNHINLSSVIHRDANINSRLFETTSDFLLYGNLSASSDIVNYSGEIYGNAKIESKKLRFVNVVDETPIKCSITGNLDYSTPSELTDIDETIVKGETTYSKYVEIPTNESSFNIKDFVVSLITFVLFVVVIVWLFRVFAKNYTNTERKITAKNLFAELGIGLLSILVVFIISIVLLITEIGTTLSFTLIFAYILVLFLSIPLFVLDIGKLFENKLNFYLTVCLIALALFLIGKIPAIGGLISFCFTMIGAGRIIRSIISKKHNTKQENNKDENKIEEKEIVKHEEIEEIKEEEKEEKKSNSKGKTKAKAKTKAKTKPKTTSKSKEKTVKDIKEEKSKE